MTSVNRLNGEFEPKTNLSTCNNMKTLKRRHNAPKKTFDNPNYHRSRAAAGRAVNDLTTAGKDPKTPVHDLSQDLIKDVWTTVNTAPRKADQAAGAWNTVNSSKYNR